MIYQPMEVLPAFTDERIRATYGPEEAAQLLLLPVEYRQAAEIEVARRTLRTEWRGWQASVVRIGDASEARRAVVAEIRAQLAHQDSGKVEP